MCKTKNKLEKIMCKKIVEDPGRFLKIRTHPDMTGGGYKIRDFGGPWYTLYTTRRPFIWPSPLSSYGIFFMCPGSWSMLLAQVVDPCF